MLAIGHLAKTYGLLPSYVAEHATAYDLMIEDVYSTWEAKQSRGSAQPNGEQFRQEDLMKIMQDYRNKKS